jgi:hypothetical protein
MIEIEVSPTKVLNVLEVTEDGYFRYVRAPGNDVSVDPLEVQEAAAEHWTKSVIADYQSGLVALIAPSEGPTLPTTEERLAAVEDAVLELALGGL